MVWETSDSNMVTRTEAKSKIVAMAKDQGIKGAFKVFYDGALIATPDRLPDPADITLIRVSAVLDQAV